MGYLLPLVQPPHPRFGEEHVVGPSLGHNFAREGDRRCLPHVDLLGALNRRHVSVFRVDVNGVSHPDVCEHSQLADQRIRREERRVYLIR